MIAILLLALQVGTASGVCSLSGRVQVVNSGPADYRVRVVDRGPADLRVRWVSQPPRRSGEWREVDAFPDFTIRFVDAFPDFTVRSVTAYPGCT